MKKNFLIVFSVVLTLGLFFGDLSLVCAQENDTEEFTLEEITVTAQKREENLQKVPITMETISGYDLSEMGKTSIDDILTNIAGAWIQGSGVQFNIVMRGMDNDEGARSSFSMTAINLDGVYSNNREVGSVGTYDLQRVEVLVGPQGTLYSRNASAGVVNFVTNNPNLERFEGTGTLELGNFDQLTMTGVMNAPINDKVAMRVAFNSNSHEGYASNGTSDNDTKEARVKILYEPNEDLSMVLTYEFVKMHGQGKTGYEIFEDEDDVDNPWTVLTPLEQWRVHRNTNKANLNLNWTTPLGILTFLPSFMTQKAPYDMQSMPQFNPATGEMTYSGVRQDQDTDERAGELRMASLDSMSWKYMLGVYYYFRGTYSTRPAMGQYQEQENDNFSVFGNMTYPLSDRFRLTLGGRYTADDEYFEDIVDPGALRPGQQPYSEAEYRSSHFDYKLAVEHDVAENSMLWVDYSTGYKHTLRGGEPQELKTYQIGSKNRFLEQRLQVNATAFYNDYSNYSVMTSKAYWAPDPDTGILTEYDDMGRGTGSAITYGLDLSTNYLLTVKDRVDLQASLLKTKIDSLRIIYDYWYPPSEEYEGLELNNAPKLTATLSYQHTFDLRNGGNIRAKFSTRYQTKTQLTFFLDENQVPAGMDPDKVNYEPTHTISEVGVTYNDPDSKWNLNGYVKNIENHARKYAYAGMMGMIVGNPRTYGAVLSINF